MKFQIRLRFTRSLLLRSERACFIVGFVCLGFYAAFLAQAWFLQAYENWAFEQDLRGAPASYAEFFAGTASPALPVSIEQFSTLEPNPQRIGFELSADDSVLGRIEIPRIGVKAMIHRGVSRRTLAVAVGHIPGTALPGSGGNVGIAGHRDTFFRNLRSVRPGDSVIVTTFDGSYEYRVESSEVVGPGDTRVLENANRPELTLVTCYPFYYVGPAPERFIVHAGRATFSR